MGQRALQLEPDSMKQNDLNVGVVGSSGLMGQWLAGFFRVCGYKVIEADPAIAVKNDDVYENCDIVFISVPLRAMKGVTAEAANSMKTNSLLVDIASVKHGVVAELAKTAGEALSLHPMFGAPIASISGQTILEIPVKDGPLSQKIREAFKSAGAKLTRTTSEEHDRSMALVQALYHANLIALGAAFKTAAVPVETLLASGSPLFKVQLSIAARVHAQNPELYADIAMLNPYTKEILSEFNKAVAELNAAIEKNDRGAFAAIFSKGAKFFEKYAGKALQETDALIQTQAKSGN
jgi:prephenate dehydrogenase